MKAVENFDLTAYNSYRIHASCQCALFPENEDDLVKVFSTYPCETLIILGNGNNVILSRSRYESNFVILNDCFNTIEVENQVMTAESGATMLDASERAYGEGLTGLEIFYDIPSSVGGAVVMNAGASGEEIKDILVKVRYLDLVDMKIKEIQKEEINFSYRNSFFQKHTDKIVLKAWFKLTIGDPTSIKEKMDTIRKQRWAKQPRDLPNCGSVFKRPPGFYVGKLVQDLDLKGYTRGGAKISEKHGGFIVNFDNASGQDILEIVHHVQDRVREKFNVDLEIEQRII